MIASYLSQVADFHRIMKYRQPEPTQPDLSDPATNELRPKLIAEELHELRAAIDANDRLEQLDALCDIQYVTSGAVLAWGMRMQFDAPTITLRLAKIHDMNAHLAEMFGVNAIMEVIAKTGNWSSVVMQLRTLQSHLSQLVWSLGFASVFDPAFGQVHENNMSKLWQLSDVEESVGEEVASEVWQQLRNGNGHYECDIINADTNDLEYRMIMDYVPGFGIIVRRGDGKILKPDGFVKVSLDRFV